MNHFAVSQICFNEQYTVPADQTARRLFQLLPHGREYADRLIDALATGYLVAVLESICLRELQWHLDAAEETVVGASVQCNHRGPIPAGAVIRVTGWVEGLGDREVTFRVQAQDESEQVCDGTIRFLIVRREYIQRKINRKREVIARRETFATA